MFLKKYNIAKIYFILFLLLFFNTTRAADNYKNIAGQAYKAYSDGQYYYAIDLYDSILKNGVASSAIYYNLGNAYFKTNQLPFAILYYEKAKKLSPSDDNINYNLNLANSLITDKIDEIPRLFYERWWHSVFSAFSSDAWAKISIVMIFLFFIFLAIYLISNAVLLKKLSFSLSVIFLLISAFTIIFAQKQYNHAFKEQAGIVFSPRLTAKSSPDENSIDLFVIHEGTKVQIKDNLGDWCEIGLANGNIGWIKRDIIKPI